MRRGGEYSEDTGTVLSMVGFPDPFLRLWGCQQAADIYVERGK